MSEPYTADERAVFASDPRRHGENARWEATVRGVEAERDEAVRMLDIARTMLTELNRDGCLDATCSHCGLSRFAKWTSK